MTGQPQSGGLGAVGNLFQPVNQAIPANPNPRTAINQHIGQGVLMSFAYSFWRNDPYPVIIATKVTPGKRIKGINLHYLPFYKIKELLNGQCNNPSFSWQNVKGDTLFSDAFRSYKWGGIRQVKVLDCQFLLTVMGMVRSFDPAEIEIIRRQVQEQIRQQVNPKAYEVTTPIQQMQPQTAAPQVAQIAPAAPPVQQVPTVPTTPQVGQTPPEAGQTPPGQTPTGP
jgi:hypothetical protein